MDTGVNIIGAFFFENRFINVYYSPYGPETSINIGRKGGEINFILIGSKTITDEISDRIFEILNQ